MCQIQINRNTLINQTIFFVFFTITGVYNIPTKKQRSLMGNLMMREEITLFIRNVKAMQESFQHTLLLFAILNCVTVPNCCMNLGIFVSLKPRGRFPI